MTEGFISAHGGYTRPFESSGSSQSALKPKNPIETNTLTAEEYVAFRNDVGWGSPSKADTISAIKGSLAVFVKRITGKAVGTVRIVGDGRLCFYIQDLMVLRSERKKGIATELMRSAIDYIDRHAATNAFIGLMAAKGVERLYEKFGFIIRPNETQGPGMIKFQGRPGETSEA